MVKERKRLFDKGGYLKGIKSFYPSPINAAAQ